MPAKKTKPAIKTAERTAPSGGMAIPNGPGRAADAVSGTVLSGAAAPPNQLQLYEAGIHLFHMGKFREAQDLFAKAGAGPDRGIGHRADLHARMCQRRMEEPVAVPQTAEEHYNYGVALINTRELAAARDHLQAALALDSGADHILYALGLCCCLSGDLQAAYENLKRAIELQPRNRIAARQDADFAPFLNVPPIDRLLHPEKKSSY